MATIKKFEEIFNSAYCLSNEISKHIAKLINYLNKSDFKGKKFVHKELIPKI